MIRDRKPGGPDPIANVEQAAKSITILANPKARLERLNELLAGKVDLGGRSLGPPHSGPMLPPKDDPEGKALLHRRALLVTALNKDSLWG